MQFLYTSVLSAPEHLLDSAARGGDYIFFTILTAVVIALVLSIDHVVGRVRFWWGEGEKLRTILGYQTPPSTMCARKTRWLAGNLFRRFFIGPLKVKGAHHLKYNGRLIVLLTHQTERDAILAAEVLGMLQLRTLMAVTQIFGIRTPLAGWSGIIAVHHDQSPSAALKAAIRIMGSEEDSSFLAFPQGALSKKVCQVCRKVMEEKRVCQMCGKEVDKKHVLCPDDGSIVAYVTPSVCPDDGGKLVRENVLRRDEWFDGTMMIAKLTAKSSKAPVAVVVGAAAYDRNPKHATLLHRFFNLIGWKSFRSFFGDIVYGAGISFSEPIPVADLGAKYDKMMDSVFHHVVELSDELYTEMDLPLPLTERKPEPEAEEKKG